MNKWPFICLFSGCSAAGTAARYLLGVSVQAAFGPTFPVGTLTVNLIGSFLISLFMYLGVEKGLLSTTVRMVLCTGVMGGFTTYSSFNFEATKMLQERAFGTAALYFVMTVGGCLLAGVLGVATAKRMFDA